MKKDYKGAAMTMDFVNADVTNILRLIGEVSNLNIVWGPEVKGIVSMRLKDVPWDQALDLILDNNNLAKREQGNVIWVTTKAQLAQIEAEERRKIQEFEAKIEAERKKIIQEKEKERELEPLLTEYIPVDFAKASEIMPLLTISETGKSRGGKLSMDSRTNTIIFTDIASNVEIAKGHRQAVRHSGQAGDDRGPDCGCHGRFYSGSGHPSGISSRLTCEAIPRFRGPRWMR